MRGYWKNGARPISATPQQIFENYSIFLPANPLILVVILMAIVLFVSSIFHPTYTFKSDVNSKIVRVEYQKWAGSNEVHGMLYYSYESNSGDYDRYKCETAFKGTINGNTLNITLKNPTINSVLSGDNGSLPKQLTIIIDNNTISLNNVLASGGRGLFSLPWTDQAYEF
jgi:hypothetical protein